MYLNNSKRKYYPHYFSVRQRVLSLLQNKTYYKPLRKQKVSYIIIYKSSRSSQQTLLLTVSFNLSTLLAL